jgi:hypothetical protein
MEAVVAVGVAAAAVQFLDYSVKTLALCREMRDSPSGSTKANEELTKSINKFTAMQKDLRKTSSTTSSTYRQLIRAVQDCSAVGTELLQLLEHIREQAKKSGGVVRAAWQAMAKRKTIERLQDRLGDCQTRYHVALTTDMRDEVLRLLDDQGKSTKSIQELITHSSDSLAARLMPSRRMSRRAVARYKKISLHSVSVKKAPLPVLDVANEISTKTLTSSFQNCRSLRSTNTFLIAYTSQRYLRGKRARKRICQAPMIGSLMASYRFLIGKATKLTRNFEAALYAGCVRHMDRLYYGSVESLDQAKHR